MEKGIPHYTVNEL